MFGHTNKIMQMWYHKNCKNEIENNFEICSEMEGEGKQWAQ